MALKLDMPIALTAETRQMALRIGIGALLLAAAAYVLVVMPLLAGRKLDAEIASEKARLERQQAFLPTMSSLASGTQNATLAELVPARQEPVPRAQAYLLTEQLAHMATAAGLEPLDVSLSPASMAQDPNTIQAQGVFSGQMDGQRSLLLAICRMPSLSRLEKVEMRAVDGRLEMMVQMRIALGG